MTLSHAIPAPGKSFKDFSVAKLLRYNVLLSTTVEETEITKSPKCDLSLCANGMVYHIGVCATAHNIPGFLIGSHGYIEKLGTK